MSLFLSTHTVVLDIFIYYNHPIIISMFIGQGISMEDCCAAQAERWAANTAMAQASASAAAAADEWASSASLTCFSPTAEMDSIASPPPTGASTDCPSGASIDDEDLTGSLAPLFPALQLMKGK